MKALRKSLFSALGLVILIAVLVPSLSHAFRLAKRVAGSYLAVAELEGLPSSQLLITINRDRTLQVSTSNDFGSGASQGFTTLSQGAWEETGDLEISGTIFGLVFDNTGLLVQIGQSNFRQVCIDELCNMIEGDLSIAFFLCNVLCPNPQDEPPPEPFFQTSGTFSGQRIIPAGIDAANTESGPPEE